MRALCPGQDTRFWRSDDIFEIACTRCGTSVEFFRDEDWLYKQDASELTVLHGVVSDKTIRLLEAL